MALGHMALEIHQRREECSDQAQLSTQREAFVQVEDLKQFRQWESRTPGHPENFLTPGVEVTTGELSLPPSPLCFLLCRQSQNY